MAVTVGEVQSVLTARDEMTAAFEKAAQSAQALGEKLDHVTEGMDAQSSSIDGIVGKLGAMAAGYLSVSAVLGEVKAGLEFASDLEETSRATGIATDELQKLDYVGNQFGITGDMMARVIEALSARLAKGDKNAASAVEFLGLSVDNLLAKGPENAFLDISEAASKLQDPMEKNGVLAELLGGRMGRLIASMGDVKEAMDKVSDKVLVSPEAIDSAHQAEVALKNLWQQTASVTALGVTWWTDLVGMTDSQKKATEATAAETKAKQDNAKATDEQQQKLKDFLAQKKQEEEEAKKAAEEQKKYAAAWEDLSNVGEDYKATLAAIDDETKASVQYYLDAGAAIGTVAKAFELSASQAKAFQEAAKQAKQDEKDWEKAQADLTAAWVAAGQAEDALFKQRAAASAAALKTQQQQDEAYLADRYKKGLMSEDQYQGDLLQTRRKYEAMTEAANNESLSRQLADLQDHEDKAKQALEDRYNQGLVDEDTYQETLSAIDQQYADKRTALNEKADADQAAARKAIWDEYYQWLGQQEDAAMQKTINDAAQSEAAMGSMSASSQTQYDLSSQQGVENYKKANGANTINWSDQQIIDYIKAGHTLAQVIAAGGITPYGNMPGAMGFADGGVGDFGTGTPAMLHGKEAIVPLDKAAGMGLGSVTNHFYVNGTAEDVARKIASLIMQTVSRGRLFGSAS